MSIAITAFNQITIMFILILIGILSYKIKLIDQEGNKRLSDIVLMLVNPLVIFLSYQREFDKTLLSGLLISLVLGVATHLVAILLGYVALKKKGHEADIALERFGIVYSNCGFIGIPLVNGVIGSEGVFYLTAYLTIFNLAVWTHGMLTVSGKSDRKTLLKALLSPSIIATFIGFLFFLFRIMLPNLVYEAFSYIGNMNTPLPMLVAGITIAQTDMKKILTKFRIYYITILKLLVIPFGMFFIFNLFPIPDIVLLTSILAVSCPTAVTVSLFAIRYDKNYQYASEIFAVTTICSIVTIPLVMLVVNMFI